MSISSQRFRFLDEETNVGTSDFLSLSDNSVYTAAVESADSVVSSIRDGESVLGTMADSISDLMDKVSNASSSIMQKIKNALNAAIDKIMNMKLPGFITKILDSLKSLDLGGVKSFFKDLLRVGSAFLCNNLDFLKSFMLGYSLTENILSGLLIGLLLSWLDRYCKGFTRDEVFAASNKGKLGMMFGSDGITLTPDTVFGKFSNAIADFNRFSNPYTPNLPYGTADFLTKILQGDKKDAINNLRGAEISSKDRKEYIAFLDSSLTNYPVGTTEYNQILDARADLINTPLIAQERIDKVNSYSNLTDALGSIALNVKGVDLSEINTYSMSETEKTLLAKLEEFKATVESNKDIQTRDHETGSFSNFDFSTVMPVLTQEETNYLSTLKGLEESHRYNGLHPTTEVFTESTMPGSTRVKPDNNPDTIKEPVKSYSGSSQGSDGPATASGYSDVSKPINISKPTSMSSYSDVSKPINISKPTPIGVSETGSTPPKNSTIGSEFKENTTNSPLLKDIYQAIPVVPGGCYA